MASKYKYKDKDTGVLLKFGGQWISWAHTAVAYTAFISALVVGISLHYNKLVKNEFYGYPDEWFPSVSATIGDRYPERSIFMILIAITSGPRFALVGLWYLLTKGPGSSLPGFVALMGLVRTLTCGGWTYITSTDDHDWHDILMISYIVATLPWTIGCILLSPSGRPAAVKYRKHLATAFFGTLVPLIYFYIQHKVHRVAGAYTTYAFFEWMLIILDVAFDAVTTLEFSNFEISVAAINRADTGENGHGHQNGNGNGVSHELSNHSTLPEKPGMASNSLASSQCPHQYTLSMALDTIADIYHGFVFWSILTSLGVVVWYFPLWYMGISGFEAFIMSTASPMLLAISSFRRTIADNPRAVHLLSLVGVASYLITDPTARLCALGFGLAMACLGWTNSLFTESANQTRFESKILGLVLGLVLSSTVKFIWYTNNPIWPVMHAENGGWNGTGLFLGVLAAWRFTRKAPVALPESQEDEDVLSPWLSACGIGSVFFGLHSLLSDSSTMILWVWEGYPIRGPVNPTHSWFTIAAMSLGILAGVSRPKAAASFVSWVAGTCGAMILTFYKHWFGYYGGLTLAAYLAAVSIPLISASAKNRPAVSFGVGFCIYNFLVLFHVWVVAYAFVPGGPLVREKTDWVMMLTMFMIGLGIFNLNSSRRRRLQQPSKRSTHTSISRQYFGIATVLINVIFLSAAFTRLPTNDHTPYHPQDRILTAGIWTVHFSIDNDMWASEYRMRDLIRDAELDVVGLLETDQQRIIMGNRDSTQFLAEDLGMYVDYGPAPTKHTWGAALLSKFPIVKSEHHLLPSPVGELAPAIHATLDVYGMLVDVFVFHSGQEEDVEDRRLQSIYMRDLMGSTAARPAILLSYLVTKPKKGNYNRYVSEKSGMHDVDPSDWDRWCEYILYKGLKRVGYARISRGTITDTELQVAKFVVPRTEVESAALEKEDEAARNRRARETDVPEGWRFPGLFKGKGLRGHAYHVFKQPRYFN